MLRANSKTLTVVLAFGRYSTTYMHAFFSFVFASSALSASASASLLICGFKPDFEGEIQLYSSCGGQKSEVIKIERLENWRFRFGNDLSCSDAGHKNWVWMTQSYPSPSKKLGYVKFDDSKMNCSQGF